MRFSKIFLSFLVLGIIISMGMTNAFGHGLGSEIMPPVMLGPKFVTIEVARAKDDFSARRVAFAIANSPLVKTAIHGGDPNWGRIVSAAAACGEPFEAESTELRIGEAVVFRHGIPVDGTSEKAAGHMSESDILFRIDLGLGHGRATVWTCDLSREYITINADYHT
jgi:glutamate N-acetyltransferase/amino-acid N-acetyltransferase